MDPKLFLELQAYSTQAVTGVDHFLQPRVARAQMVKECSDDETKYRKVFQKLFAPHIRLTTEADLKKAKDFDQKFDGNRGYEYMRFIKTSLTQEQVEKMKSIVLSEGISWKDVVGTLHTLEEWMYYRLCSHFLLPTQIEEPDEDCINCYVWNDEDMDLEGHHLLESFYFMPMVSEDYPGQFELDINDHAVTPAHLQVAHQIESMYHAVGKSSPNAGREAYSFDFVKNEPSTGMFICLSEGLCAWNRKEHRYELVYPISALRSLYGWCKDQLSIEEKVAPHIIKQFLSQSLVISYQFQTNEDAQMVKSNSEKALKSIRAFMKQFDLHVVGLSTRKKKKSLQLFCTRKPQEDPSVAPIRQKLDMHNESQDDQEKRRKFLNYPQEPHLVVKDELSIEIEMGGPDAVKKVVTLQKVSVTVQ